MDISKARCISCGDSMSVSQMYCAGCDVTIRATFEVSPLGRLTDDEQSFVVAFLRSGGSIKQMESLLQVSYPTVKNRLAAIVDKLPNSPRDKLRTSANNATKTLTQLKNGEISVATALVELR